MKRIPPPCPEPATGPQYWRSLDQLADTPDFREWVEREFPAGASEFTDDESRRHFIKIMSASFLLAGFGLSGCRRPVERIIPFSKVPEGYVHGVPQYYATAMPVRGSAIPLVAKSTEGRPVKIEGNALHPDSNGATDLHAQASILNLYDPDRSTRFAHKGAKVTREAALEQLDQLAVSYGAAYRQLDGLSANVVQKQGGQGLAFLVGQSSSPSRERLVAAIQQKLPKARWFMHEAVDHDIHRRAASQAFGQPVAPLFQLESARVIVSLDADFIGGEPDAWRTIRGFARGRKQAAAQDAMSRLYAVEGLFTLTGGNADHRLRVPPSQVVRVAAQVAIAVLTGAGLPAAQTGSLTAALNKLAGGLPAGLVKPEWIAACAKDLLANQGKALVLVGHRQPLEVHLIAHVINAALGAVGHTLWLLPAADPGFGTLPALAQSLQAGEVETLVILGCNSAYDAPAGLNWPAAQQKAARVVRLGYYEDETAALAEWNLPLAHYLESWGDARTPDGTLVPVQPLVEPLFGGLTELEVLARLGGLPVTSAYEIVRETFRGLGGGDAERWKRFLHDGHLAGSAAKPVTASLAFDTLISTLAAAQLAPMPAAGSLEVAFHADAKVDDGRYNNNGWLQELPDPVTKMTWDNVILMSARTAGELGLSIKDYENNNLQVPVVKVAVGGLTVEGPAWIQPGMADHVVALALGYGRPAAGRVGKGCGYNAYSVRPVATPWIASGATVSSAGRQHKLSTTQNHWVMEGRPVVREANLEQYRKDPHFAKGMNMHEPPGGSQPLYPNPLDVPDVNGVRPRDRSPHAWGMAIDLSACVGCSACMVACQSENNVPIVGRDLVSRNREMHWLRLDRYYAGPLEDPQMVTQPMMCQHCESAPCENVCPVNATAHDEEGLNVMAYNRCVGTRYCSNNCAYKVRRFNYLDYNKRPLDQLQGPFFSSPLVHSTDGEWDLLRWFKNPDRSLRPDDEWELLKLVKNPDVTVRMRGVMEKCTFCVQRIEQAKIAQKVKAGASAEVEVPDGVIKTACQQACPAEAIVFGNIKDPNSRVSQAKRSDRDYSVLEFLLTKPRATYQARIRNPNPEVPDRLDTPASYAEWAAKNHAGGHAGGGGHGGGGGAAAAEHGAAPAAHSANEGGRH